MICWQKFVDKNLSGRSLLLVLSSSDFITNHSHRDQKILAWVPSRITLVSRREGVHLAMHGHTSSDGVAINYGRCFISEKWTILVEAKKKTFKKFIAIIFLLS